MFTMVLAVGSLNLALGFLSAIALERPAPAIGPWIRRQLAHLLTGYLTPVWKPTMVRSWGRWRPSQRPKATTDSTHAADHPTTPAGPAVPGPAVVGPAVESANPAMEPVSAESRLDVDRFPRTLHFDGLTSGWLASDPERVRLVGGVLIAVDDVSSLRSRLGEEMTEQLIAHFQELLVGLVRKGRGYDRVVRLGDGNFLLFLGDTALRNALNASERIRQSVASTTFTLREHSLKLTASCAASEWHPTESPQRWIDRLGELLEQSQAAGGNCTYVADDKGPRLATIGRYPVSTGEIRVEVA